jgi:hypothetical protein
MKTFEEFWPFYLSEHAHPTNRRLHFIGTFIIHIILLYVFATADFKALVLIPFVGYGFAWIGHLVVEKNRPATFKHPLWSLRGDFKMFYMMLAKKL